MTLLFHYLCCTIVYLCFQKKKNKKNVSDVKENEQKVSKKLDRISEKIGKREQNFSV